MQKHTDIDNTFNTPTKCSQCKWRSVIAPLSGCCWIPLQPKTSYPWRIKNTVLKNYRLQKDHPGPWIRSVCQGFERKLRPKNVGEVSQWRSRLHDNNGTCGIHCLAATVPRGQPHDGIDDSCCRTGVCRSICFTLMSPSVPHLKFISTTFCFVKFTVFMLSRDESTGNGYTFSLSISLHSSTRLDHARCSSST
jgi:hypothetical protein